MHELAITQNILDIVLDEASAVQANRITKINLVIGELSGVVSDSVEFYFDFLSRDSVADKAVLDFKLVPSELHCRNCLTNFSPQNSLWVCPSCRNWSLEVVSGRDCYIESIEVE